MSFHPELHFSYLHPRQWDGKPMKELAKEINGMEKKMKDAIDYNWANHHIKISGLCGKPTISLQFYNEETHGNSCNSIDLWNAKNGVSMGSLASKDNTWLPEWSDKIVEWPRNIEKGLTMCNSCKKWVKEIKFYSFAGGVCVDCYDPKKHLSPDTRGD